MKKVITILALALTTSLTFAQDTPLEISGSADLYYKYDFSGNPNIGTSFATDQNSLSLGMIDVVLKKKTGKASFVGEVSFGPRGQNQSIPKDGLTFASSTNGDDGNSFHIQNLYAAYAVSDKFTLTAGFMGTFVGYEVISPLANFHYSTSYLFTNGPFQNAGVKGTYAFSGKVSLMAGLFNDQWNVYQANQDLGLNAFGAQLALTPVEGLSAYINFLDGSASGTIIDLTAAYQITEKFKLGLNVADFSGVADDTGYTGFALYPSYAVNKNFSLGLRAENFKAKKFSTFSANGFSDGVVGDESVTAFTLSANLKSGGLTFIPEFRMDSGSENMFSDSDFATTGNTAATKSASQVTLSVVYGF
jgi:hypothetical protein